MKQLFIQTTFAVINAVLGNNHFFTNGDENLHPPTGAKLYYRGGGWWLISGYHCNGKDTDNLHTHIRTEQDIIRGKRCGQCHSRWLNCWCDGNWSTAYAHLMQQEHGNAAISKS
tara:strand:+ start:756 stop:1097 length:342 start_codon:yes stop_codon:yes gene_type:complete